MKLKINRVCWGTLTSVVLAMFVTGCAQQQKTKPTPMAEPKAAKTVPSAGFGPSYTTFDQGGQRFIKGSMAFPSGRLEGSGLLLEKVVPAEVMVGKKFSYEYRVINLTDFPIQDVVVWDRVTSNVKSFAANPAPASVTNGIATWNIGNLPAKGTKTITVEGISNSEGEVGTCGWAKYSPVLCEPIKVVKADIQLVKQAPATVVICDPIPMTLTVKNSGSSALRNVVVTDNLPAGLTVDGKTALSFNAGDLAPGQSKEFKFNAVAAKTGKYTNVAKATSAEGLSAEDTTNTTVTSPVLALTCETPAERFIGRPVEACFTVKNTGDADSAGTVVTVPVPAGLVFQGATAGGRVVDGVVVWDIGNLPKGQSKEVCATFTGSMAGVVQFASNARGTCAKPVTSSCQTKLSGIPAILLEVIDLVDPIEVGGEETYEVVVTNQGSAPATNVKIVCTLEPSQTYISTTGATAASVAGQVISMSPVASIAPKAQVKWQVKVKAAKAGDIRFSVKMTSDQISRPVEETESTNQY